MVESLTISNAPLEQPGMDFARLRQEGIQYLERLAGTIWTDYNTHDPGITILEVLCYGITDLSYRLSFEMKDLLAHPAGVPATKGPAFFTAREILTVNPLTLNDYRKLLIDIVGVKNAWLEIADDAQPTFHSDPTKNQLTFEASDLTEPVVLNGLYRVLVEKEKGVDSGQLMQRVRTRLHQHRNLCEDFDEINILPVEAISLQMELGIEEGVEPDRLIAQIYLGLDRFISPSLEFHSLAALMARGNPIDEIFAGPSLQHGFLDDEQLNRFDRKTELHTSDLIRIILEIEGIKTVKSIAISSSNEPSVLEEWALELDRGMAPQLTNIDTFLKGDLRLYKGQIPCQIDPNKVKDWIAKAQKQLKPSKGAGIGKNDPLVPQGSYRQLSNYVSLQNEFPMTYGIGEVGLPPSATELRKAQAKQLQAYLAFFDQLLANYFAQLDRVKDLFSVSSGRDRTYFFQQIPNLPGRPYLFNQDYETFLAEIGEDDDTALERHNRFLDHLMAQYCETFTDYSLLLYQSILPAQPTSSDLSIEHQVAHVFIQDKIDFLTDYPQMSAGRGKACDYAQLKDLWGTTDISGLKQRISKLLGISLTGKPLAESEGEGFYLLENILLRPRLANDPDFTPAFLELGDSPPDLFSFQLSFIFPDWFPRFQNDNFRIAIADILIAQTPAHISIISYWLDRETMTSFETLYDRLLQKLGDPASDKAEVQDTINRLIELLELGTVIIPRIPDLIGQMTIGKDFAVAANATSNVEEPATSDEPSTVDETPSSDE